MLAGKAAGFPTTAANGESTVFTPSMPAGEREKKLEGWKQAIELLL